ncbi:MAG: hypothetical protein JSU92_05950 [Deltaproteobacteria bacterium]|nr:MAG: hypothetical protein JSU92_05950 [Deltaproteobacteria bacterium]
MSDLSELISSKDVTLAAITDFLEKMDHPERIEQVVALNKERQIRLWEIAEESKSLTLDYLVPGDAKPLVPYPFEGKNSLPLFTRFQKVFYRDNNNDICGYNKQTMMWFTGPGYFMVQMNPKNEREIQIDYTRIPSEHPPKWPEIKSNDIFPSRFIYGGTKDNLRWVSKDVVIGRAFRMGEVPMPNWFVLCRKQPI